MHHTASLLCLTALAGLASAQAHLDAGTRQTEQPLRAELSAAAASSGGVTAAADGGLAFADASGWIDFPLEVETTGRYRCQVAVSDCGGGTTVWIEDYIGNEDGRCYDITAPMAKPRKTKPGASTSRMPSTRAAQSQTHQSVR